MLRVEALMWRTAMLLFSFEFATLIVGTFLFVLWSLVVVVGSHPACHILFIESCRGVRKSSRASHFRSNFGSSYLCFRDFVDWRRSIKFISPMACAADLHILLDSLL